MDTTILRIIIAAIGVAVVSGIYFWDFLKKRKAVTRSRSSTREPLVGSNFEGEELKHKELEHSEFLDSLESESVSTKPPPIVADDLLSLNPVEETATVTSPSITTMADIEMDTAKSKMDAASNVDHKIIQFSLVPKDAEFFSGNALLQALTDVGLECGEKGIFHRFHEKDGSKYEIFNVASLIEPGTFPMGDMSSFQCPGITLFLQTDAVPDALEAFDDLTDTGHDLVFRLFGKLLDGRRQEVTMADFIEPIRDSLIAQSGNHS